MFRHFEGEQIDKILKSEGHQYLVGNLKRPQIFPHIFDENLNIGIGEHNSFDWEKPHYHCQSTEYQFVIEGDAKYVDLNENVEYYMKKGDFFVIPAGTSYILKANKGAKILFVKYPAVDDKVYIDLDENMLCWIKSWEEKWNEKDRKRKIT